jgi:hypothetical protein
MTRNVMLPGALAGSLAFSGCADMTQKNQRV